MSNNNWNDPNAGQQGWNPDPNAQQGWDAQQQPASDPYGQQQGWDAQPQPSADPYGQPQPSAGDPYAQPQQGYGQADPYAAQQQGYGATGYDAGMNPYGGYAMAQPQYASWGKRALGALIDWVAPSIVFGFISSALFPKDVTADVTSSGFNYASSNGATVLQWGLTFAWWAVLAYLSAKDGQTPGRKMAKTRLVSESGGPLSFGMGFVRYLCHILDQLVCCIGFLFPLWDKERQTFADKIMKTHVIEAN